MIHLNTITIPAPGGTREIYITPVKLNLEELRNIEFGEFKKLYIYDDLMGGTYTSAMPREFLPLSPRSKDFLIYYGQNFEDYYLGEFDVDFDNKVYTNWKGNFEKFNEEDQRNFGEHLWGSQTNSRTVTIFTPTKASDINVSLRKA